MENKKSYIIGLIIFILPFVIFAFFPCSVMGHTWEDATCISPKTCYTCGKEEGKPLSPTGEHKWEDATCIQAKKCIYCGETEGAALGHDFVGATCTVSGRCSRCGEFGTLEHQYSINGICNICGEKKPRNWIYLDSDDDDFWRAVVAAQNIVKDELKSPSSAKFPLSDYTVRHDLREYYVSGYVDSQNSFGAMVRTLWSATFEMGSDIGEKYKISNYNVEFYH